jgi:hypothetical protein|tara:strand:+ start:158 stop:571 length:414 start_codon:yes stop_codon:yes gene_type:complete
MKKFIYLFISSTLLISCNSIEDDSADLDPIIGTWKLTSLTFDGKESDTISACEKKSTATYQEKGTGIDNYFSEDNSGRCNNQILNFSWKNIDNSKYLLGNFEVKLEFSNNNNTYQVLLIIKISDNKEVVAISTYSRV